MVVTHCYNSLNMANANMISDKIKSLAKTTSTVIGWRVANVEVKSMGGHAA